MNLYIEYVCCLQVRPWRTIQSKTVHLLCDARSTPPRVAAVLCLDGAMSYTDCAPEPKVLEQFKARRDNQIASLEMLAIAYGRKLIPQSAFVFAILCFALQAYQHSRKSFGAAMLSYTPTTQSLNMECEKVGPGLLIMQPWSIPSGRL